MNAHDSERLAGLLEADGMESTDDVEAADVVLLNTCCIRENADNKLYGHLGHLKAIKERRPGMQIAVGGCLAQKDGDVVQARAPHVDVVLGTHNVANAAALLRQAAARSSPSCCGRSARWTASAASATRVRIPRTCGPRRSRRWRRCRRCASTCTCHCRRGATASSPPCAGATRPSAISNAWPRRA